jgi:hypothetical protein
VRPEEVDAPNTNKSQPRHADVDRELERMDASTSSFAGTATVNFCA